MAIPVYANYQPLRGVVSRVPNPPGSNYCDEVLECGHVLAHARLHQAENATRRCPDCPRMPPKLDRVEVVESEAAPYDPADPKRPGWYFALPSGRPSLRPTGVVYAHPDFLKAAQAAEPADYRLCPAELECAHCGAKFRSFGSYANHLRDHGRGGPLSCSKCERTFSTRAKLLQHLNWHRKQEEVRAYVCGKCGRACESGAGLSSHIRHNHKQGR
jgi:DNA-directed RNA polymerase subunit RPC12/RpoP